MVVCLAAKYSGKPISAVYAIDPVTGTELDVTVRFRFCREDLADIYAYRRIPDGAMARLGQPDGISRSRTRTAAGDRRFGPSIQGQELIVCEITGTRARRATGRHLSG